jgi:hypothetical protein
MPKKLFNKKVLKKKRDSFPPGGHLLNLADTSPYRKIYLLLNFFLVFSFIELILNIIQTFPFFLWMKILMFIKTHQVCAYK